MMPTEEEKTQILDAQMSSPDIPLGSAENFLLTLGSISDLEQRLRLWAFTLEYDAIEAVCTDKSYSTSLLNTVCLVQVGCLVLIYWLNY